MKLKYDFVRRAIAKLLLNSLVGSTTLVRAQTYSIDSFTTAGGSGTVSGGAYSISGTVGQPDGNLELSGGGFSISGGFWSIVEAETAGAIAFDVNLILNPSAEAGAGSISFNDILPVPNWTTTRNFTVVVYDSSLPSPSPGFGTNYFSGGPTTRTDASNPFSSASQIIDVSALASQIDTAAVTAELSGYFGGFGDQNDRASLMATYLDGSANSLGSVVVGNVLALDRTNHTALLYRGGTNAVPAGTRKIQVVLNMTNDAGFYYNDGYADNLSLVLRNVDHPSMTIFDNTTGSDNGGFGITETTWLASKLCLGSQAFSLDSVSVLLNSQDFSGQAGPPSSVRLQIYANDPVTGKPSASIGVMNLSGLTNPITPPNGYGLVTWTPATSLHLSSNTCYWVVVSREGGGNIGEIASATPPTGAIATLGASRSADGGTTWQVADPGYNFKMLIQGKPAVIPVPPAQLTIFDNSKGVETGLLPLNATTWLAGKFCLRSQPYQLGSVSLLLTSGSPGGETVQLGIYANDAVKGVPSTRIGVMMNLTELTNPITIATGWVKWIPATPLHLSPNTCYWAVLSRDDGGNIGLAAVESYTIPDGDASAYGIARSLNAGTTWDPDFWDPNSNFNLKMIISGTPNSPPVPSPELAANGSTAIPAGSGNFTTLPFAPALNGDNLVFYGGGSSGQQGIYSMTRGLPTITRIADLNTPIPNGSGNFLSLGTESGIIIVGGNVLFAGRGSGGQQGIYLADHSNPTMPFRIADTSTPIPNDIGNFTAFQSGLGFDGNNVAFVASSSGGQQGVYQVTVTSPPQVGLPLRIADTSTVIPGGSGNFTTFPSAPSVSGSEVAFLGNGPNGQQGIYKVSVPAPPQVGPPLKVADTATAIPDGTGNFTSFGADQTHPIDPVMNGDRLAFVGSGSGGQQGVYTVGVSAPPQAGPARLADTGSTIPSGSGYFSSFGAVSISDTDVAFLGNGPGGQQGIYAATAQSDLFKVIDLHDTIAGKALTALNFSRAGLFGDPITFQVTFTDGSQGIYTMDVAPPPPALRITAVQRIGSDLALTFTSITGKTFIVQSSSVLTPGQWTDVAGNAVNGIGATVQVTIPNAFAQPQQFYRVKQLP